MKGRARGSTALGTAGIGIGVVVDVVYSSEAIPLEGMKWGGPTSGLWSRWRGERIGCVRFSCRRCC